MELNGDDSMLKNNREKIVISGTMCYRNQLNASQLNETELQSKEMNVDFSKTCAKCSP